MVPVTVQVSPTGTDGQCSYYRERSGGNCSWIPPSSEKLGAPEMVGIGIDDLRHRQRADRHAFSIR